MDEMNADADAEEEKGLEERLDEAIALRRRILWQLRLISVVLIVIGLGVLALGGFAVHQERINHSTVNLIQSSRVAGSVEVCDETRANNQHARTKLDRLIAEGERKTPAKRAELRIARAGFDTIVDALQPPASHAVCEQRAKKHARLHRGARPKTTATSHH